MKQVEILICTIGEEGIRRACASVLPHEEGIGWLISWQMPGVNPIEAVKLIPEEIRRRKDVRVFISDSLGLTRNRNNALAHATGDILLIGDDDVEYYPESLKKVSQAFDENSEADIILFRYDASDGVRKIYPEQACEWKKRPRGYYVSSIEMGMRRSTAGVLWFDERFGIGSRFICGEEDVYIAEALKGNMKVMLYPLTLGLHAGATTGESLSSTREFVEAKGASFRLMYPGMWPLRMLAHAWRQKDFPKKEYIRFWLRGVGKL